MRIEPAPSLPRCNGPMPAAHAAAAPALLPPGVRCRFHGLRVIPVSGDPPTAIQPNPGVVVLPTRTAPGLLQPRHRRRVLAVGRVLGQVRAAPGGMPAHQHQILDRRRHAVDRRQRLAVAPASLGGARGGERAVAVDEAERVELRLQGVEPRKNRLRRLDGRQLAGAVEPGQLRGRGIGDGIGGCRARRHRAYRRRGRAGPVTAP